MPATTFCWYELMTNDLTAAADFYGHVIGWSAQDAGMPHMKYTMLSTPGGAVAGAMTIPPDACAAGMKPVWIGYIAVDDVDATAKRIVDAGGTIHKAAEDIPGVGRFAMVADPHGASFIIFKPKDGATPPPSAPFGTPGFMSWHELHAGEWKSDFAFYAQLFGWEKTEAFEMGGEVGTYQTFAANGQPVGGIMTKMKFTPKPHWNYYFNVSDINAAVERVKAKGGQLLMGPHEVPGGSWIAQCMDPQGAAFAVIKCPSV